MTAGPPLFLAIITLTKFVPGSDSLLKASAFLKALSNKHRLLILYHLIDGTKTVSDLERLTGIGLNCLSQNLRRLRRAELEPS